MAARQWTSSDGRGARIHKVTVIVLHGAHMPFGGGWAAFGPHNLGPLSITALREELPRIKQTL